MSNIVMSDEVVGLDAFRVIRTSGLAAAERAAVDGLIELVDAHEGLRLPLMAEPPGLPPGMQRELFLGYEGETLVGFASLEGEPDAELCGLVHPAYRRRGIGAALLAAARSTGRERGAPGCLVVCDEASPSGPAFAVAAGGQRRFAEYRMLLDVAQFRPPAAPDGLQFRQAGAADLEKLVRVTAAAFGDAEEKVRP
ncbi:MAG: GNAT family N-acetyltransferase, partial [Chloroflexi bacterium]|nr:GNAT family N-acetyltransferase [Chloroflexota bacterium]